MTHRESVQSNVIVSHGKVKLECELGYHEHLDTFAYQSSRYKAEFTRDEYNKYFFSFFLSSFLFFFSLSCNSRAKLCANLSPRFRFGCSSRFLTDVSKFQYCNIVFFSFFFQIFHHQKYYTNYFLRFRKWTFNIYDILATCKVSAICG